MKSKEKESMRREVAGRLKIIRDSLRYDPVQMARRLKIKSTGYYKNERGVTLPGPASLDIMQKDLGISMDWFLFGKGPMYYDEKQPEPEALPSKEPGIEETFPETKEMLDCMKQDPRFRHQAMLFFYDYKDKTNSPAPD